jgi:hypothetical protein
MNGGGEIRCIRRVGGIRFEKGGGVEVSTRSSSWERHDYLSGRQADKTLEGGGR